MIEFMNKYILGASVPMILMLAGLYFAVALRFFPFTRIKTVMGVLLRRQEGGDGESPARALAMALAGTLGVGNIVGVSSAVYFGGAGAIFWMLVSAFCSMFLKYAEILIAMKGRKRSDSGYIGGAPYYIKDCLERLISRRVGVFFGGLFAILCAANSLLMGGFTQINAVASSLDGVVGIKPMASGVALALICAALLIFGKKALYSATAVLVPLMSCGFILLSLVVIIAERELMPSAISAILKDAFSLRSASGGVLGFLLSRSLRFGTMRGLFSNEAGCGTSPTAHITSTLKSPVEQGFWGIFEVFADTIVMCSMTALIVVAGYDRVAYLGADSIMMTIKAYSYPFSGAFAYAVEVFITVCVLCFGFATILCWANYGAESVAYFSRKKSLRLAYIAVFCICVAAGAVTAPEAIWSAADLVLGAMTLINVTVLILLRDEVKRETELYFFCQQKFQCFISKKR